MEHFLKDEDQYLESMKSIVEQEEKNYNDCTSAVLTKLGVTKEQFMKTEQALMMDPMAQMELLDQGMENEDPGVPAPKGLT